MIGLCVTKLPILKKLQRKH